jgi:uncharacterized membrane protein (DUF106 family)
MTSYLQSKNRSVRFARLRERAFEVFISHVDIMFPALTVIIYGILIISIIMGIADYATSDMSANYVQQDMSQSMRQSSP